MDSESKDDSHPESRAPKKMTREEHKAWADQVAQAMVDNLNRQFGPKEGPKRDGNGEQLPLSTD
jgi:hypothetical protein